MTSTTPRTTNQIPSTQAKATALETGWKIATKPAMTPMMPETAGRKRVPPLAGRKTDAKVAIPSMNAYRPQMMTAPPLYRLARNRR